MDVLVGIKDQPSLLLFHPDAVNKMQGKLLISNSIDSIFSLTLYSSSISNTNLVSL